MRPVAAATPPNSCSGCGWRRGGCSQSAGKKTSFFESVPRFPWREKLWEELRLSGIAVLATIDGPEFHGEPAMRQRIHGVGINLRTTRWCGPSEEADVIREYSLRFHRHAVLSGTAYLQATPADIRAEMAVLAKRQNFSVDPGSFMDSTFDDWAPMVLPPAQIRHARQHMALDEKHTSLQRGGFFFDAHQNVGFCSCGPDFPRRSRPHS